MTNDQLSPASLQVLLRELSQVVEKDVAGDIVELGCYKGLTSLEIQKQLQVQGSDKKLFLYDSFEGLPSKSSQDESPAGVQFRAGELEVTKREVVNRFKRSSLPLPFIYRVWFKDIQPKQLPDTISLAFLDGDFYESIMDSLKLIWPRLVKNSVVVVDDYTNPALPGANKAISEWLSTHQAQLKTEAGLAIIRPKL